VTPTFYFIISIRTISSVTEKNISRNKATFLANEINTTERYITGPTTPVQIVFPLKKKTMQGI